MVFMNDTQSRLYKACGVMFLIALMLLPYGLEAGPRFREKQEDVQEDTSRDVQENKFYPIPKLQVENFAPSVQKQLLEGKKRVEALAGGTGPIPLGLSKAYGDLGHLYHAYKLTGAAEVCYRNALKVDSSDFKWMYSLAYLYQGLGKFEEALKIYQEAKPGWQDDLSYLWHIRIGECYRSLNQIPKARLSFEEAYQLNPEGAAVLSRLGDIALKEKRYDDAVLHLEKALRMQPAANKLYYSLGMAYRGKGDKKKAREYIEKKGMVGVQPPDPLRNRLKSLASDYLTLYQAGKLAYSAGRFQEARESFELAIEADPEKSDAYTNLGAVQVKFGDFEEAIENFLKADQLSPGDVTVAFNLGQLYASLGKSEQAVTYLSTVVKKEPKDNNAQLALADALRRISRHEKAARHYRAALKGDPGLEAAWLGLSSVYIMLGRGEEAIKILGNAVTQLPNNWRVSHVLAGLLASAPDLGMRNGARALELAMKAYQLKPDFNTARTVAMAHAELNQCPKAVEWIGKAIVMAKNASQPKSVIELLNRNLVHLQTNDPCRVPGKK